MVERNQIHKGMVVRSSEGKRLGKVVSADENAFTVEKGIIRSIDYVADYENVTAISNEEVWLSRAKRSERSGVEPPCYGDEGGAGRG